MSKSVHHRETYKAESDIVQRLRDQGLDASQDAIYSLYLSLNNDVSSVYWADVFSKPDIFFVVDIEGRGSFLVPQIHNEYSGEPILERIVAKEASEGSRIVVRVLDDDSSSDALWNSILRTRVNFTISGQLAVTQFLPVAWVANGSVQLLDRQVAIDPPDYIASVTFVIPKSEDGKWVAKGTLVDSSNHTVGSIELASLWSARADYNHHVEAKSGSLAKSIFWGIAGASALLLGLKHILMSREDKEKATVS